MHCSDRIHCDRACLLRLGGARKDANIGARIRESPSLERHCVANRRSASVAISFVCVLVICGVQFHSLKLSSGGTIFRSLQCTRRHNLGAIRCRLDDQRLFRRVRQGDRVGPCPRRTAYSEPTSYPAGSHRRAEVWSHLWRRDSSIVKLSLPLIGQLCVRCSNCSPGKDPTRQPTVPCKFRHDETLASYWHYLSVSVERETANY